MLRTALNQAITEVANQVLPFAHGDPWRNQNFMVFFDSINWLHPTVQSDDPYWETVASLSGEVMMYLYTDEMAPIDLTPLMIALQIQPIWMVPNPNEVEVGSVALQLRFKPAEMRDQIFESVVVPTLRGPLTDAYILKRTNYGNQQ